MTEVVPFHVLKSVPPVSPRESLGVGDAGLFRSLPPVPPVADPSAACPSAAALIRDRAALVRSARTVLTAPGDPTRRALLDACDVLLTWGDTLDHWRAREVQRAILALEDRLSALALPEPASRPVRAVRPGAMAVEAMQIATNLGAPSDVPFDWLEARARARRGSVPWASRFLPLLLPATLLALILLLAVRS